MDLFVHQGLIPTTDVSHILQSQRNFQDNWLPKKFKKGSDE